MILHLGFELPKPAACFLDHESEHLTSEEIKILKSQIRKNARLMDVYIERLDLLVNKEKYPRREAFIERIRQRLFLLMDENDTFRKVLWKQARREAFREASAERANPGKNLS